MFSNFPATGQQEIVEHVVLTAHIAELAEWDNRAHVKRVRRYTYILARGTGLEHDEAALISTAAMLHDLGKAAIPAELSQKAAKFTPDEYKIAEQHTVQGHRLLSHSESPLLQTAAVICLTHHERWDGSGYPKGLRGEAIPLSGRMVALADVFDALTTKRPYKAAIGLDSAAELIKSSSGTLFDPAMVSMFEARFDDFQITLHMKDEAGGS